ncbi:molecular chaperone DnaK [Streptomyces azureus]|uniref:Molecular chaperone DnaK n=1 Tax=Streptomyces azureus TaxID=146537 RepID=A0A0K8PDB4_STRAJ|nr:molecular chaperone DnaK [Streptomyces azureus]
MDGRSLARAQFEQLTADLFERCKAPFHNAIKDAWIKVSDIDHVVLVGGSTRMPAMTELVKALTGKEPHKGVNPDEVADRHGAVSKVAGRAARG